MARPRKDSIDGCARGRIIEAFWQALEQTPVHEITVGSLVDAARCNRGTFYYHFADMESLISSAVREEMVADDLIALGVFSALAAGDASALERSVSPLRMKRMVLAIRAGELQTVEIAVRQTVQEMWSRKVCREGEELTEEARFAIQFMVGGILGFITWAVRTEMPLCSLTAGQRSYVMSVARTTIKAVAAAQGMAAHEVVARLRA